MTRYALALWLVALLSLAGPMLLDEPKALANDPPGEVLKVDDDEFAGGADVRSSDYVMAWDGALRFQYAIPADGTDAIPQYTLNGEPYNLNSGATITAGNTYTCELIFSRGDEVNFRQSATTRSTWRVHDVRKGL